VVWFPVINDMGHVDELIKIWYTLPRLLLMKPLTKDVGIDNFTPAYTTKDQNIEVSVGTTMVLSHYFVNL